MKTFSSSKLVVILGILFLIHTDTPPVQMEYSGMPGREKAPAFVPKDNTARIRDKKAESIIPVAAVSECVHAEQMAVSATNQSF